MIDDEYREEGGQAEFQMIYARLRDHVKFVLSCFEDGLLFDPAVEFSGLQSMHSSLN